jgi:S-DNA-T family DNA segregation ATPase FtsK/SpoIIIE
VNHVWADMGPDQRRELAALLLMAVAALGFVALHGSAGGAAALEGVAAVLRALFGLAAPALPAAAAAAGLLLLLRSGTAGIAVRGAGGIIGLLAADGLIQLRLPSAGAFAAAWHGHGGGLAGVALDWALKAVLGSTGSLVALLWLALVALLLLTRLSLRGAMLVTARAVTSGVQVAGAALGQVLFEEAGAAAVAAPTGAVTETPAVPKALRAPYSEPEPEPDPLDGVADLLGRPLPAAAVAEEPAPIPGGRLDPGAPAGHDLDPIQPRQEPPPVADATAPEVLSAAAPRNGSRAEQLLFDTPGAYRLPPLDLLRHRPTRGSRGQVRDAAHRARVLEETLASFGVEAHVTATAQGPTVTRFEVQPGVGVQVRRVAALSDDLALAMAAADVRIVAPIPGKSVIGIEVPNAELTPVYLRDVLEAPVFRASESPLTVALGEDVGGTPVVASLDRLLHVLIAGATGSGKSISINALLTSLLYKAHPEELRLLLIDPKMVELSAFNGIPHLLAPVITDPKRAANALRLLLKEMEHRYLLFTECGARDIGRYNEQCAASGQSRLPYIVVVVDELADLMLVARADVENSIQRIAQMARAAGIHLVAATQRPSVDVITGVIKANIPSRIAFAVASQPDSRTILDGAGAEKLVGRGDMLYYPLGAQKPVRVQGAFVSEAERDAVVGWVREQAHPEYHQEIMSAESAETAEDGDTGDALFARAVRVVAETGQASVSMLQRRLRVGFTRAGRLIDMMEERGLVGPHKGSKSREVLITVEGCRRLFGDDGAADGPP